VIGVARAETAQAGEWLAFGTGLGVPLAVAVLPVAGRRPALGPQRRFSRSISALMACSDGFLPTRKSQRWKTRPIPQISRGNIGQ
jgi:hypothetical protein